MTDRASRTAWLDALLARAVAEGALDAAGARALRTIAARDAPPDHRGRDEAADAGTRRAPSAVLVAYSLGAGLVVVALAWFVVDRWAALGAVGVLGVALGYAALFVGAARLLAVRRFTLAAGFATLLAACTTPLAAWALLRFAGEWPAPPDDVVLMSYGPYLATRLLVLELSAVAVALAILQWVPARAVRRDPVSVLLAGAGGLALLHTGEALAAPPLFWPLEGWVALAAGGVLLSSALATDAVEPPPDTRREDHARWLYAAAMLGLHVGLLQVWSELRVTRHLLPLIAVGLLALGVRMRRRVLLAVGAADAIGYVTWLAFEIFRATLGFPFALAASGAAVIGGAVLAQRRWPGLVHGEGPVHGARPVPGGWPAIVAPALLALALVPLVGVPRARRTAARIEREAIVQHPPRRPVGVPPGTRAVR